jgi:hypothetical protein
VQYHGKFLDPGEPSTSAVSSVRHPPSDNYVRLLRMALPAVAMRQSGGCDRVLEEAGRPTLRLATSTEPASVQRQVCF